MIKSVLWQSINAYLVLTLPIEFVFRNSEVEKKVKFRLNTRSFYKLYVDYSRKKRN